MERTYTVSIVQTLVYEVRVFDAASAEEAEQIALDRFTQSAAPDFDFTSYSDGLVVGRVETE